MRLQSSGLFGLNVFYLKLVIVKDLLLAIDVSHVVQRLCSLLGTVRVNKELGRLWYE